MKDYKIDVYNKFYKDVFPKLKKMEQQRITELVKMCVLEFAAVCILVLCIYNFSAVLDWWQRGNTFVFLIKSIVLLIPLVLPFIIPPVINGRFQDKLKDELMPEVVKCFPDLVSDRGKFIGGLYWDIIGKAKLFNFDFWVSTVKDTFHGSYNGTEFDIAEVTLREKTKNDIPLTIFNGAIISFDCNKRIGAHTLITSKSINRRVLLVIILIFAGIMLLVGGYLFYTLLTTKEMILDSKLIDALMTAGFILLIWWLVITNRKLSQEIKLEFDEFNKRYKIESEDQIEARYLITTAFIERFMNLTTEFGTKDIQCAFFDGRVLFAISTNRNLFELGSIYKPLTNPQNVKLFDELISIIDMIDYFKLDEKTGL